MTKLRNRLTYANVMATIAVFIALGGASYAATRLPKNSVGTRQLRKEAVSAAKIKAGAVTPEKLNDAAQATLTGPQGAQGPQGAPGSAKAWAEISNAGMVLRSFGGIKSEKLSTGIYCIEASGLDITNSVALATLNYSDITSDLSGQILVATGHESNQCGGNKFQVVTGSSSGTLESKGFIFAIP